MALEEKNIILEARNLSVGYSNKKAESVIAEEINFSIEKGELVGLVGANGIGKSTLLRTLTGMQNALNGDVFLKGKNLKEYSSFRLATQLSVVLTEAPASKNLSVLEMISLGRQPYTNWIGSLSETDKKAINFALEATETTTLAHRKCYELSDGQMQRVAIARALAQDTPIIILDEPTTHLDIYHRAYVLKLLKKLASETQKTILFSTHEIDLAIQLTDKMLVMANNENHFDSPCKLIKAGRFDALFPKETIDFDGKTGRFTIRK
ncbi:ABC-type cobalamin/Fe3+-siderophore transport system, ATPase component [Aequorivita sublithincola DSM 14238]|uniref:ABC-type cobalamin/Fe3+-siderophore transport system, ATPase component n=1 Tax=Aequorivita sublithincola (strain DSM 14238 / LMG 21431 / ACAM 643 / 9-3) TaxID=746697 RepID=I3YZM5_AEQSU|nr:ABC transporter ATP-binding protein [Aequorivita sublithincola]AFL82443.1 ABC-type cobalamin/Fe3+-siderophore transport system, ATPase component [Aequorivita sublithincola DSM 14238]